MTLMEMFRLTPFQLVMNLSARHFGSKMYQKELGACHGDDLLYLFPFAVPGFPKCLKTESDQVDIESFGIFNGIMVSTILQRVVKLAHSCSIISIKVSSFSLFCIHISAILVLHQSCFTLLYRCLFIGKYLLNVNFNSMIMIPLNK
jgi:hypothetical protein